ncbi:MAG: alginate lyase family protein [bacterium]|nr:alginate lyase family protein [bacterium]
MRNAFAAVCATLWFAFVVSAQAVPKTLVLDGFLLEKHRIENTSGKSARSGDIAQLINAADKILRAGRTYSVTKKSQVPPSGSKNDYMSLGPYWWPDPSKPNGLPYIRRDGERNPEIKNIPDDTEYNDMLEDSEALALAYFFTRDEKYAKHATTVLRTWFLDPKTRMNPNLNFGQGIPGISTGRGIGMIETRNMFRAIDAAIILQSSQSWPASDHVALKNWFREFLKWSIESPLGKDEADEQNNHGTYYDVQVVAYSLFTDQIDVAKKQLELTKERIASQVGTDGSQPHELARTLSWGYVNMNGYGFVTLARLGESAGVDLWHYRTKDGRGVREVLEWIVPFAAGEKEWTYKQIKPRSYDLTVPLLEIGALKYKNSEYSTIAAKLRNSGDKIAFRTLGLY